MEMLAAKFFGASLHAFYSIFLVIAALVNIHKTPSQDKRFTNPVWSKLRGAIIWLIRQRITLELTRIGGHNQVIAVSVVLILENISRDTLSDQ